MSSGDKLLEYLDSVYQRIQKIELYLEKLEEENRKLRDMLPKLYKKLYEKRQHEHKK